MMDNDIKKALDELVKLSSGIVINWEINQSDAEEIYKIAKNALDLINRKDAEIEKLNVELVGMRGACESYKIHYDIAQAEIERLTVNKNAFALGMKRLSEQLETAKSEAIKEFAKKVETELDERVSENIRNRNPHWYIAKRIVRETAIEMTEVKNNE